ncbi:hypothetical protein GW17_00055396, partial [Ensete ventricosum]
GPWSVLQSQQIRWVGHVTHRWVGGWVKRASFDPGLYLGGAISAKGSRRVRCSASFQLCGSMASPPLSSPSGDDGGSLVADPGSQAGSAAGSLQGGDGVLSAPPPPSAAAGPGAFPAASSGGGDDADYGFQRPGFRNGPLVGTVQPYDRHLFLCYKSPEVWPSHVEGSESDRLPRFLAGEIKNWASSIDKKVILPPEI